MADTHASGHTNASTRAYCPDCGPAGVSHFVERWSVRADALLGYMQKPPAIVWQGIKPVVAWTRPGRLAPAAARTLAALGLGEIVAHADEKNNWRARVLWEEAERRGIVMREFRPFGLAREIFYASYRGDTRGFDGLPARAPRTNPRSTGWTTKVSSSKNSVRRASPFHAAGA